MTPTGPQHDWQCSPTDFLSRMEIGHRKSMKILKQEILDVAEVNDGLSL
jgi:hypothetical protein